jgi:hypothetical protein
MLGVNGSYDCHKEAMKAMYNIPDTRPILTDSTCWYLVEGGDKKYYLWNDISDKMARIEEPSLKKILAIIEEGEECLPLTWLTSSRQEIEDEECEPARTT